MRSGIKGLDDALDVFPESGVVIVAGGPGIGKTAMAAQFIHNGVVMFGERGVYVSFSESKEEFYSNMSSLGMNFEELEKKGMVRFLSLMVTSKESLMRCLDEIVGAIYSVKARRVVIDSISIVAPLMDMREIRHFVQLLRVFMKSFGVLLLICETSSEARSDELDELAFVADAVLLMRLKEEDGLRLRELEILKARGIPVEKGVYEFDVDRRHGGVWVIAPPKNIPDAKGAILSTGLSWFDEAVGGGLRQGSLTLIKGETGSGKTCLCAQVAVSIAASGKKCIYISTEEGGDVAGLIKGFAAGRAVEGVKVVDIVPEEHDAQKIYSFFDSLVHDEKPDLLIVDSLTAFKHSVPQARFYKLLRFLQLLARANNVAVIATLTLPLIEEVLETDMLGLFDNLLVLRSMATNGGMHRLLFPVKVRGRDHRRKPIRLEVTSRGVRAVNEETLMPAT